MQAHTARAADEAARSHRPLPVILVPGAFGQDWVYWNVMQYLLERDGYHVYSLTFPRFTFADLRASAALLAEKVEAVTMSEDAPAVNLVGHSMGGLIARHFMDVQGGAGRVNHLVCLGTPHHGTYTALGAPILAAARQVTPGSSFLAEVARAHAASPVPITNIYSRFDTVVLPPRHAHLEGPLVRNHIVGVAGHWGVLVSPRVYRWLKRGIDHRRDGLDGA